MSSQQNAGETGSFASTAIRCFGWMMLAILMVFIINNFVTNGLGWPSASKALGEGATFTAWLQLLAYPVFIALSVLYVMRTPTNTLRGDGAKISNYNMVLIRCAFWAVLIVGLGDVILSFLRVEGFLPSLVGEQLAKDLGVPKFRGLYFHMPLLLIGVIVGLFAKSIGFTWLALLIVFAELLIVISRFVFSYEQAFMSDLVRFWYAALFLFASAYTLLHEGHVRVDVFYAGFSDKMKGKVNAIGSIVLGMSFCWTILIVGMGQKTSIINSPLFNFEVSQAGFGMYIKYMMAGFLGLFAISMLIQFVSYLMEAMADIRGEPGKREVETESAH